MCARGGVRSPVSGETVNRCTVCWLPSDGAVCSQRCRGLSATKRELYADRTLLEEAVLAAVRVLSVKATTCPGSFAEALLQQRGYRLEARDALACMREIYFALRSAGKIRFYQKGAVVPPGKDDFRGPFRLGR